MQNEINAQNDFTKLLLYQSCKKNDIIQNADLSSANVETMRALLNEQHKWDCKTMPILVSKYLAKCGFKFLIKKFPQCGEYIKPEDIRVCIEPDELIHLQNSRSIIPQNLVVIVIKNITMSLFSTSLFRLNDIISNKSGQSSTVADDKTNKTDEVKVKINNITSMRVTQTPPKQYTHNFMNVHKDETRKLNDDRRSLAKQTNYDEQRRISNTSSHSLHQSLCDNAAQATVSIQNDDDDDNNDVGILRSTSSNSNVSILNIMKVKPLVDHDTDNYKEKDDNDIATNNDNHKLNGSNDTNGIPDGVTDISDKHIVVLANELIASAPTLKQELVITERHTVTPTPGNDISTEQALMQLPTNTNDIVNELMNFIQPNVQEQAMAAAATVSENGYIHDDNNIESEEIVIDEYVDDEYNDNYDDDIQSTEHEPMANDDFEDF